MVYQKRTGRRICLRGIPLLRTPAWASLLIISAATTALAQEARRSTARGIQDNSFLVEEAYNQEPGVVQHIFNLALGVDRQPGNDDREWAFVFTQEWPLFAQTHQLSYTVPYLFADSGGVTEDGLGDVMLNYRWQALMETDALPAVSPRFSLILPTGNQAEGLGDDTLGFQFNLPVSKVVADRWTLHGNAGLTVLPDVQGHDATSFHLGASAIYAISPNTNLMLEWVGEWGEQVQNAGGRTDTFASIISPGVRHAFNFDNDVQAVLGIGVPIGLSGDAPDCGIFLYFSLEHFFRR